MYYFTDNVLVHWQCTTSLTMYYFIDNVLFHWQCVLFHWQCTISLPKSDWFVPTCAYLVMTPLHQHAYCTRRDESNTLTLLVERMPDGYLNHPNTAPVPSLTTCWSECPQCLCWVSATKTLPQHSHVPFVDLLLSVLNVYAEFFHPNAAQAPSLTVYWSFKCPQSLCWVPTTQTLP